ncbi:hypothetical protein B566_EDAN003748 [Ephemera danica]|nr:hypothetical protein B566_EDAN003748 [Ephemera danica]
MSSGNTELSRQESCPPHYYAHEFRRSNNYKPNSYTNQYKPTTLNGSGCRRLTVYGIKRRRYDGGYFKHYNVCQCKPNLYLPVNNVAMKTDIVAKLWRSRRRVLKRYFKGWEIALERRRVIFTVGIKTKRSGRPSTCSQITSRLQEPRVITEPAPTHSMIIQGENEPYREPEVVHLFKRTKYSMVKLKLAGVLMKNFRASLRRRMAMEQCQFVKATLAFKEGRRLSAYFARGLCRDDPYDEVVSPFYTSVGVAAENIDNIGAHGPHITHKHFRVLDRQNPYKPDSAYKMLLYKITTTSIYIINWNHSFGFVVEKNVLENGKTCHKPSFTFLWKRPNLTNNSIRWRASKSKEFAWDRPEFGQQDEKSCCTGKRVQQQLWVVPPPELVWAAQGQDAELPCDVTPPVIGDRVNMVLWFKDNAGIPLYRSIGLALLCKTIALLAMCMFSSLLLHENCTPAMSHVISLQLQMQTFYTAC